jgi:glycosyltransferase involved in cell wall biosynthesis
VTTGTIIIAAHNEEAVIGRTLDALVDVRAEGQILVVVVCNGCTDRTAEAARARSGVAVAELALASKAAALREGDRIAVPGPRIYLDADIVLTSRAAVDVLTALSNGAIAGRPPHVFDTRGASRIVSAWYRVRQDLPSISTALWGAGCYALSEAGRQRFDEFPDIVSDDLFIDSKFAREEVTIVDTDNIVVTTPRRLSDLLRILRRSYRTQTEIAAAGTALSAGQRAQLRDLWSISARSPRRICDVIVYVAVVVWARIQTRMFPASERWERDASSRMAPTPRNEMRT